MTVKITYNCAWCGAANVEEKCPEKPQTRLDSVCCIHCRGLCAVIGGVFAAVVRADQGAPDAAIRSVIDARVREFDAR